MSAPRPLLAVALALAAAACTARPAAAPAGGGTGTCVAPGRWVEPKTRAAPSTADVVARAARARVVLLGEHHDRADHHRWQLQTLAAIQAAHPDLVVGIEMLSRRAQPALDRFAAGLTSERDFLRESEWAARWGIDPGLYLPLLHFARLNGLPLRALNVDRDTVAAVRARGDAAVPPAEREGVGHPAPASPEYAASLQEVFDAHDGGARPSGAPPPSGDAPPPAVVADDDARRRFVDAQLLWDRAMAEGIAAALAADPHALVVGIMGAGHVEHGWGVPHQLAALGIRDVVTLLPWDADADCADLVPELADAVFGVPAPRAGEDAVAPRPRLGVMLAMDARGPRIEGVVPGTPAEAAGLRAGDVVVGAAGKKVESPAALRAIVDEQPPDGVLRLRVLRNGKPRTLTVRFSGPR